MQQQTAEKQDKRILIRTADRPAARQKKAEKQQTIWQETEGNSYGYTVYWEAEEGMENRYAAKYGAQVMTRSGKKGGREYKGLEWDQN